MPDVMLSILAKFSLICSIQVLWLLDTSSSESQSEIYETSNTEQSLAQSLKQEIHVRTIGASTGAYVLSVDRPRGRPGDIVISDLGSQRVLIAACPLTLTCCLLPHAIMSLPMLVNGADCGPSNPLQGLSKRFDQDRGIQQVSRRPLACHRT